jgi:small subunit ribosomal protein S16
VVAESRFSRNGRYVESIGIYEPQAKGKASELSLNMDRIIHWTEKGAKATDTVAWLISKAKSLPHA